MSAGSSSLELKKADVTKFLACSTHLGATNLDYQMEQYVFKRRVDGVHIINLKKTYEKLLLAARAIVAVENPTEVCVISGRQYAQRAILKFAAHTGSTPVAGRFTPGTFTNQIQAAFKEPRLLIVSDPRVDHQALTEASYVNIPVIAFCNTDSPLRYVDIAIPCNNKAPHSVGLMWWMLAREVLRLRGSISREIPWDVMVDLYLWRDQELDKETEEVQEAPEKAGIITEVTKPTDFTEAWTDQVSVIQLATEASVEPVAAGAISSPLTKLPDDWSLGGTTDEWSAKPSGIEDWGATATDQW